MRQCSIAECEKPGGWHVSTDKPLCGLHYQRWLKTGERLERTHRPSAEWDYDARTVYLRLDGQSSGKVVPGCVTKTLHESSPLVNADYDSGGNLIGIEVLW